MPGRDTILCHVRPLAARGTVLPQDLQISLPQKTDSSKDSRENMRVKVSFARVSDVELRPSLKQEKCVVWENHRQP